MRIGQVLAKKLTADGAVSAGPGKVWAVTVISDGANAGSVVLKDGGATGAEMWRIDVPATAGATETVTFPRGLSFETSIYADLTNVAAVYVAYT